MSSLEPNPGERILSVNCDEVELHVKFADGRRLSVPLSWYPRLAQATSAERANWEFSAAGFGIHWPELDEDLSAEGLLRGAPAPGAGARSA
ncbi:MAG: DUF2442 domain-containing protein [Dehalococcoidia bacterium]|nr:DUF2442 domain-containing protein [Dehalococcoidia bacterium]MCA9843700.1 DUF2442 domain-containing protein [Dehalococcoidia bacterium]MCA9854352.1 DUF2442 domain-containing protein [Dehalococcoidia bacterium]